MASCKEGFAITTTTSFAPSENETPFVDLMLHPDKLEAALKIAKRENDAFEASRAFSRSPPAPRVENPFELNAS